MLLLGNGRIAGISGILAGWHSGAGDAPSDGKGAWRSAFLAGLIAPAAILSLTGFADAFAPHSILVTVVDWGRFLVAGVLVGFGTRWANGCTSGHGVCGLARLSLRSMVAVIAFMTAAMLTVWLVRHVLGNAGWLG